MDRVGVARGHHHMLSVRPRRAASLRFSPETGTYTVIIIIVIIIIIIVIVVVVVVVIIRVVTKLHGNCTEHEVLTSHRKAFSH